MLNWHMCENPLPDNYSLDWSRRFGRDGAGPCRPAVLQHASLCRQPPPLPCVPLPSAGRARTPPPSTDPHRAMALRKREGCRKNENFIIVSVCFMSCERVFGKMGC